MEEGLESHLSLSLVTQLVDRLIDLPRLHRLLTPRPEALCGSLNGGSCETSSPFHTTATVLGLESRGTLAHLPSTAAPVRDVKGAPLVAPIPSTSLAPVTFVFRVRVFEPTITLVSQW